MNTILIIVIDERDEGIEEVIQRSVPIQRGAIEIDPIIKDFFTYGKEMGIISDEKSQRKENSPNH